ncbi:MAG TPA: hypothetical protein V6D18_09690, partial [Thermosynechococcaceae cyanobacterium]
GFNSYGEICQWLETQLGITACYKTVAKEPGCLAVVNACAVRSDDPRSNYFNCGMALYFRGTICSWFLENWYYFIPSATAANGWINALASDHPDVLAK